VRSVGGRIEGIEEALPAGEEILWQGAPDARAVARHVFHQRTVAVYLLALSAIALWPGIQARGLADGLKVAPLLLLVVGAVLAVIAVGARMVARTSLYVITEKRVVLRVGVAFPMAINVPLRLVQDAGIRVFNDGTGEVKLGLDPSVRLAWLALWPHARSWRLRQPEPLLLGLSDPRAAGAVLQQVARREGIPTPEAPRTAPASSPKTVALA
jgi:hypothetical protein